MITHKQAAASEDDGCSYRERYRASEVEWRNAAYDALKDGPLTALELGKRILGNGSDKVLISTTVRRASKWPSYFRVCHERDPATGTPTTIDIVQWDYSRRKTV